MTIRKSTIKDIDRMMEIYAHSRTFMAAHGNPNQWGPTHWPPRALIEHDIRQGHSYVCVDENGRIVGTFFFIQGPDIEPTYGTSQRARGWTTDPTAWCTASPRTAPAEASGPSA